MKIRMEMTGDREYIAKVSSGNGKVAGALRRAISVLAVDLQAHIVRDKLSGQVLKRVSGDLSRSVSIRYEDGGMTAVVGANVPYAAKHEYGFSGTESVRAHVRRNREQMKSARRNALGNETRPSKAKGAGSGVTAVNAFSRQVNYPARSYMRTGLADMREQISNALTSAVVGAFKK